jgi:hypothetical protein
VGGVVLLFRSQLQLEFFVAVAHQDAVNDIKPCRLN